MKRFAVLLAREVRRRIPIQAVSIGLGLFVVAVPWLLGGMSDQAAAEIRGVVAVGLAALWSLGLAVIDGLGFLATDLRERRMGFDFRQPVPGLSIWGARLAAACVSVVTAAVVTFSIPTVAAADLGWGLAGADELLSSFTGSMNPSTIVLFVPALVGVLVVTNVVGLALASRSKWFLLDFLTAILLLGVAAVATATLWKVGAQTAVGWVVTVSLGGGIVALLLGSLHQIMNGRTESDRAHQTFSKTVGLGALAIGSMVFGGSWWLLNPRPGDLIESRIRAIPLTRNLVHIDGAARFRGDLVFGFVLEPRSGRKLATGIQKSSVTRFSAKISLDESTLVWPVLVQEELGNWTTLLRWMSPGDFPSAGRESPIVWQGTPYSWAVSPEGTRIASVWRDTSSRRGLRVILEDLRQGDRLKEVSISECGRSGPVLFPSEERIRYGCGTYAPSHYQQCITHNAYLLDIDLVSGAVSFPDVASVSGLPLNRGFAHFPGRHFEPPTMDRRYDVPRRNARLVVKGLPPVEILPPPPLRDHAIATSARFLSDGSLAVIWYDRQSLLAVYDRSGSLESTRPLPGMRGGEILAEIGEDRQLLLAKPDGRDRRSRPVTGLVRMPLDGSEMVEIARVQRLHRPVSANTPTTVFEDMNGALFWLDLESGQFLPLVPDGWNWGSSRSFTPGQASTGSLDTEPLGDHKYMM